MKKYALNEFVRGWFVGDFTPSIIRTTDVEVAVQTFESGSREARHYHGIAKEVTVIISGRAEISGVEYLAGDIVEIAPGECTQFTALEPTVTVVVKYPGAKGDKYLVEAPDD